MLAKMLSTMCSLVPFAVLAVLPVSAREKVHALPLEVGAELAGRSLSIARHEKPSFVASTAGKASFAMFGTGAMIANGNRLVQENAG